MKSSLTDPIIKVTSREDVALKERDQILESLKGVAKENYQHAGNKIVQDQMIIVLGGACGIGKTRLGHEFFKEMKKEENFKNSCYIYLKIQESEGLDTLLDTQKLQELISNESYASAGVIFLHIDEIQRLPQKNFNALRKILRNFMSENEHPKLIPIFSGVPAALMADVAAGKIIGTVSNSRFHIIRLGPLSDSASKTLLQEFYQKKTNDSIDINDKLEAILASCGGIPRVIEKLSECLEHLGTSTLAYENLYENLRGKIFSLYNDNNRWMNKLVEIAEEKGIKSDPISDLETLLTISLANQPILLETKLPSGLEIKEIEKVGFLVLSHLENRIVKICVPLIFFDILGGVASNLLPPDFRRPLKMITWDSFEVNKNTFFFK